MLTTGNKSETAVGYSTLYGDSAGGFAPIKDVPKTLVFALSRYVNERAGQRADPRLDHRAAAVGASCATTSATTSRCRRTTQLDPLIEAYVEDDLSPEEIARRGLATLEVAQRVARLVDLRRVQAPAGAAGHQACTTRRSAATGACRSRTASVADAA